MLYFLLFAQVVLVFLIVLASVQFYRIVFRGFAPFISTRFNAILAILKELNLKGDEIVYELGSGKAGFLRAIEQKFGNQILFGVENSWWPYLLAKMQIRLSGSKIELIKKDLFKVNLKEADIIYCFLNKKMMLKLRTKFQQECRPGTLIISYHFRIPGMDAERIVKEDKNNIFFYRI